MSKKCMTDQCPSSGKVRHSTRTAAKRHLRAISIKGRWEGKAYVGDIYYCPCCDGFHVGRKHKRRKAQ